MTSENDITDVLVSNWNKFRIREGICIYSVYTPSKSAICSATTQLTFTCSSSTIETIEKVMKYVQINKTMKTREGHQKRRSDHLIVNFEHFSHFFLVFLLLTLNK